MEQDLLIRYAEEKDIDTLIQFNQEMALETEGKELQSRLISAGVQNVLKQPDKGFYLVAERNQELVGSLMITTEWSDWRNGYFWWIQSVYILPSQRRKGIFRKLYQKVKNLALDLPEVCGLRLYVEQENKSAQKTYIALGMYETPYRLYEEEFLRKH